MFSLRMVFTVSLILAFTLLALVAINRLVINSARPANVSNVSNFSSCVAAGYPVMESMPRRCASPDGKMFVEDLRAGAPTAPLIIITAPASGAYITNPTTVKGFARGYWFFEASFPVEIRDAAGALLAIGPAQAENYWMTEEYVPFSATLAWSRRPSTATGSVIFRKDNPSGLPENDASVEIPVSFSPIPGVTRVNVFFANPSRGSAQDCRLVFPLSRDISATSSIASATLAELMRGPNDAERAVGYISLIPPEAAVRKVTLDNGTIIADFTSGLSDGIAGSCMVGAIRSQIEETLRQFPAVSSVVISVDGRTEDVLQP